MTYQSFYNFFTILTPTKIKVALLLIILLLSLMLPEVALAGPSYGSTGS